MKSQSGRSMVEMLSVLAIIGVLSVGAIAGYSKAMIKYRLNKHAEAVNMLINNVLQMKDKLKRPQKGQIISYNSFFHKMNALPEGIMYNPNTDKLYDAYFKEAIHMYYNLLNVESADSPNYGGINFSFQPSDEGAKICQNILMAAKENAANLFMIDTAYNVAGTDFGVAPTYGDNYCNAQTDKCIRNIDLEQIDYLCHNCNGTSCTLEVMWK